MSGNKGSDDTLQGHGLEWADLHGTFGQTEAGEKSDRVRGVEQYFPSAAGERRQMELAFRFGGIEQQQQAGRLRRAAESDTEATLIRVVPFRIGHFVTGRMPPADVARMARLQCALEKSVATQL